MMFKAAGIASAATALVTMMGGGTTAHADIDPVIPYNAALFCAHVEENPTPTGMYTVIRDMAQHVTPEIGVDSVIYALAVVCPRYQPLMKQTMAIYGDSPDDSGSADRVA